MSDTPRTDAVDVGVTHPSVTAESYRLMRDHARQLERDLSRVIGQFNAAVLELAQRPEARKPDAYLVEYREVSTAGGKKHCVQASLEPHPPTIMLPWDEKVESRELLSATPLYMNLGEGKR